MVIAIVVVVELVNILLLIWMIAFARHTWLTMPPSVPFPRLGRGSWRNEWDLKENVLVSWLFADGLTWLVTSLCVMAPVTPGQASVLPFALIFMVIVFVAQRSDLKKARALEDAVQGENQAD